MIAIHPIAAHQELIDLALKRIFAINLIGVRMKLSDPKEGRGWDDAMLDWAEQEYRRFLALNFAYPERTIVPDRTVDEFWHQHILDTRAYANDSMEVFGYFLHHFPYLGTRGPEDFDKLVQCYSDTKALYELHFGLSKTDESNSFPDCGTCSSCASSGVHCAL